MTGIACAELKEYTYEEYRFDFAEWAKIKGAKDWEQGRLEGDELRVFAEQASGKALLAQGPSRLKRWNGNGWEYKKDAEPLLRETGVYEIARKDVKGLPCPFDTQHYTWCKKICEKAEKEFENWSYGRSAKLINVFIKTLMPANLEDLPVEEKAKWYAVHPPIDRRVLNGMNDSKRENEERFGYRYEDIWTTLHGTNERPSGIPTWTKFKYEDYLKVINLICDNLSKCGYEDPLPLWKNEWFFNPTGGRVR